ncbi:MAG: PLDc N-terminal domain-containing protein [Chitinophagaceae bacterium]
MFFGSGYFYFIVVLQIFCIIHCIRRGKPFFWIFVILFLPVVGSLIYLFTEVFSNRDIQQVQSGVGTVLNPTGRIKKLENNLRFSDTFNNRIALADACLGAGQTQRAIDLYESSLTGNFSENEYVLMQLVIAYSSQRRYEELIRVARKVHRLPQFLRSHAHVLYAMALEQTGQSQLAEAEFNMMKGRFANFEARYQYGCFLARAGRTGEAKQLLAEMTGEFTHLSPPEKRNNRKWISLAKDELKRLNEMATRP